MGAGITSQLGRTLISASSWHIRMRGSAMSWRGWRKTVTG
jgi:hypothetical protein